MDDAGPCRSRSLRNAWLTLFVVVVAVSLLGNAGAGTSTLGGVEGPRFRDYMPPYIGGGIFVFLGLSAFFSGSEIAFFSLPRVRLRALAEDGTLSGRLISGLMARPNELLTTILAANMVVNVFISVLLGVRVERYMAAGLGWPPTAAYVASVGLCTTVLVFFGEIAPKAFGIILGESLARVVVFPMAAISRAIWPLCRAFLQVTNLFFRVTRFHELRAAPYITDEEFRSLFAGNETEGVIQEDERQMIKGILEFSGATLREIVTPRPDVVAAREDITVGEALDLLREHEFSRMPVYQEDLDHITGVLVAKDLLPYFMLGDLGRPVKELVRPAHFVPETMSVRQFVREAQGRRTHLAVVVDEYGGTAGIVTLEDALEEVVGDILDEKDEELPAHEQIGEGAFRIEGSMRLDELSQLIGIEVQDEEHETVAGFLMDNMNKVLEPGDSYEYQGALFTVESCEERRASSVIVRAPQPARADEGPAP